VLFSAKNTPNIIIPDIQNALLMMLIIMGKLVGRFTNKSILQIRDQKLFLLLIFIIITVVFAVIF